jgi:hypothetical protein
MKKLLIALCMMFTLGLATPSAKAYFWVSYPYGEFSEVYGLGGSNVAAVFFCWSSNCGYWDVFTIHGNGAGNPVSASLGGAPAGMSYYLEEYYYDSYAEYYWVYVTNNYGSNWTYLGDYYIPY